MPRLRRLMLGCWLRVDKLATMVGKIPTIGVVGFYVASASVQLGAAGTAAQHQIRQRIFATVGLDQLQLCELGCNSHSLARCA